MITDSRAKIAGCLSQITISTSTSIFGTSTYTYCRTLSLRCFCPITNGQIRLFFCCCVLTHCNGITTFCLSKVANGNCIFDVAISTVSRNNVGSQSDATLRIYFCPCTCCKRIRPSRFRYLVTTHTRTVNGDCICTRTVLQVGRHGMAG